GRGYGVRMIKLALKYAFEITGVTSVQLNVFQVNAAAVRCYEKAGLKVRAVEENAFRYREEIWARCNMVIVRS
ncbi:MAG: GNAT family N-acetyltransferase, partial [Lachnospiraceae bacterium]|nr:GNAT family N-acetyltransferase [Lachnospiraceae bacterium]